MLIKKIKNQKLRKTFNKIEKSRKIFKFLFIYLLNNSKNVLLPSNIRKKQLYFFLKKRQHKIMTRITRRCVITNRNRSVYRPLGLSRGIYREFIKNGLIPGYSKGVW